MLTPKRQLERAKVKLMTLPNSVFISTILFSLDTQLVEDNPTISTAGTDGVNLYINIPFFTSLTKAEQVGLLFHEAWHVAWNHMARGVDKEPKRYNIAGDHVINLMALAAGFTLPAGGYHDKKYTGMSTQEVYDLLPPDKCSPNGGGGIGMDIIYDSKDMPEAEKEAKLVNITNTLIRAVTKSKLAGDAPGTIPGEIQVMIDDLINPKLPWRVLLQNYMTAFAKDDYTWTRPNRRYMPDFYLPSAHSIAMGHVAIAVDTSCSVSDNEFTAFRSEINDIKESLKPSKMTVIDFDTSIKQVRILGQEDSFEQMGFSGRGGTDIDPVWKWADVESPKVLIIFSDMEFTLPKKKVNSSVLWVCVNNKKTKMPFGDTIHLDTR